MDVNDGIWAYEPSVCRSLGAHYVGKSKYMGVRTAEFAIDISSPENTKECFCRDPDECTKIGKLTYIRNDFQFSHFETSKTNNPTKHFSSHSFRYI